MAFVVTAVATAIELGTLAAIATAVTEVGLALTVVGGVTGNKDLMKIGGVLSIAGGIGGFAAGAIGSAAGAGGAALGEAGTEAALGAAADEAYAAAYGGSAAAEATESAIAGMEGAASSAAPELGAVASDGASLAATAPEAIANPAAQNAIQAPSLAPDAMVAPDANTVAGATGPVGPAGAQGPQTPWEADFQASGAIGPASGTPPVAGASMWDSFSAFANKNKGLIDAGMKVVGGAMDGANQRDMLDQRLALEQQKIAQTGFGNTVGILTPRSGIIAGGQR